MKGLVIVSHGLLAAGMLDSAKLFLGSELPQVKACCLKADDSPEAFGDQIQQAIDEVNTGEGAIVFADLFGGTPFNQTLQLLSDQIDCIAGINFAMLLEYLSKRTFEEVDLPSIVQGGQQNIIEAKGYLSTLTLDDDD